MAVLAIQSELAVDLLPLGQIKSGNTGVPEAIQSFVVELIAFVFDIESAHRLCTSTPVLRSPPSGKPCAHKIKLR